MTEPTNERERERREYALEIIEGFRRGDGIGWSEVESVFDVVEPLLKKSLELDR